MPIKDEVGEKNDELVVFFLFYVLYEIKAILIKITLRILGIDSIILWWRILGEYPDPRHLSQSFFFLILDPY